MSFAVVEFIGEKSVEVVCRDWIEKCNEKFFCYWPRKNTAAKVKKLEKPDKEHWKRYEVRIFRHADTYAKANKYAKNAEETSNVESASENESRGRKRSQKTYDDCTDWEGDESETEGMPDKSRKLSDHISVPSLPSPPVIQNSPHFRTEETIQDEMIFLNSIASSVVPGFNGALAQHDNLLMSSGSTSTLQFPQHAETQRDVQVNYGNRDSAFQTRTERTGSWRNNTRNRDSDTQSRPERAGSSCSNTSSSSSCSLGISGIANLERHGRQNTPSDEIFQHAPGTAQNNLYAPSDKTRHYVPRTPQPTALRDDLCTSGSISQNIRTPRTVQTRDNYQTSVLMKLDTIIEKQNEGLQMLRQLLSVTRGAGGRDMLEDMLPRPLTQVDELNALCENLSDEDFKKKMVNYCGALCGADVGDSARRILAKIGSNNLWSSYSLKGRRGKMAFKGTAVCRVVKKTCLRFHKNSTEMEIEGHIAEFLKHAPHKPGGSRFKKSDDGNGQDDGMQE